MLTKTKQTLSDGTELQPTYHNENVQFKDYYEVTKLKANTTYTIRFRVKNDLATEWSDWSQNATVKTHVEDGDKAIKHKSSIHHHRHHERKHKLLLGTNAANLNTKRDRYNSYMDDSNSASLNKCKLSVSFWFVLVSVLSF